MALQYYLRYKVVNPISQLEFLSDNDGTPAATGTSLGVWTGNGPGIVWNNGVPNKRTWSEELTDVTDGSSKATVNVWNAGTNKALIGFNYQGTDYYFDASTYDFSSTGFNTGDFYADNAYLGPPTDRRPPVDPDFIPVYANIEIKSAPTADSHAVNKGYVDTQTGGGSNGLDEAFAGMIDADVWDTELEFIQGDVVVWQGKLFRAAVDYPEGEPGDSEQWYRINLQTFLADE